MKNIYLFIVNLKDYRIDPITDRDRHCSNLYHSVVDCDGHCSNPHHSVTDRDRHCGNPYHSVTERDRHPQQRLFFISRCY
jgi:hypothetical protein